MNAPTITTVRLYGSLGKQFGRTWHFHANTIKEVLDLISIKHPNFRQTIAEMPNTDFGVRVGKKQICGEKLAFPLGGKTLSITPVVRGSAGSKGWMQIVLGVVLVAVGVVLALGTGGIGTPGAIPLITMGVGLIIGGVAALLTPTPNTGTQDNESKTRPSYTFNGIINTIGQGECVPCFYGGPGWIGSAVVSADYEAANFVEGSKSMGTNSDTTLGAGRPIGSNRSRPNISD